MLRAPRSLAVLSRSGRTAKDQSNVDGQVGARAHSAVCHASQEAVHGAGTGHHEQRGAVQHGRGDDEGPSPLRPVGEAAGEQRRGDGGLGERAKEDLVRYVVLGAAEPVLQEWAWHMARIA